MGSEIRQAAIGMATGPRGGTILRTVKEDEMGGNDCYEGPFHDIPGEKMIVINSWEEVPQFATEEEEADFWDTHTLADHLWSKKRGHRPGSLAERLVRQRQKAGG